MKRGLQPWGHCAGAAYPGDGIAIIRTKTPMTGNRASREASGRLRSARAFREEAIGQGSHAGDKVVFVSADMIDHQLDAAARNEDADDGRTTVLFHQQLPY